MFKNTASQSIALFAFDALTNLPKTGDAANMLYYVAKDFGSVTLITDNSGVPTEINSTNAKGWYKIALSQTETNADTLLFTGKSSTSNVVVVGRPIDTFPPNFTSMSVDTNGLTSITSNIKKNTATSGFMFVMTSSSTHTPITGLTVTPSRAIDGGAFSGCSNSVSEVSEGVYAIDLAAADVNGNHIMLRFTATGADDLDIELITQP